MRHLLVLAAALFLLPSVAPGGPVPEDALGHLEWRNVGPARGGRASSVAGIAGDPMTYYMGVTGGGVWKTENAGHTWRNVTDGFVGTGSVGSIDVAPSDPNVVYVGMGEPDIRGNFSHGDGLYRSLDAGRTWTHVGLGDSRQIGRVRIHPRDANTVFVAALGHVFGPNSERGVYRTQDGGESWERVCFVDDRTGAVDVCFDPVNPRVVYAGFWQVRRTPWSLDSGGPGSGLYRSRDGGDTWEELTQGLPKGVKGKIGVSASAARPNRVWAIIEAEDGGLFRSEDGGDTWRKTSDDPNLRQRAWYYTRVYADPQDADTCYVMNVGFHKSTDGGREFSRIRVPHSDNHDLWIAPEDNRRMVNANDGGGNVSFDGGRTWSRQDMQATAQFYRVTTDNSFPYRILGAQQDNSTVSVSSRNRPGGWRQDFHSVGGGESGYIAARPDDPSIVFAGSYGGMLTRYDHDLRMSRNIMVWPENPMGDGPAALPYRFQWTFPIVISPHDPDVLYVAGNVLFKSTDEGQSFTPISPDLTTNDKTKQQSSGGPITQDNTSVEYYCTIFTVAESPLEAGLIWAGTDDGLVHLTDDGGENWTNVTPPNMGDWPMISLIEASPHDADTAWMAVNRYKMNDFQPYVFKTTDRGATWTQVAKDMPDGAFVRSIREDPVRPGLLFVGTEIGVWMSPDAGATWQPLQRNLPVVPVTDVAIKDDDLVIATQGRAFWVLPDIGVLRQWADVDAKAAVHVFEPAEAWRSLGEGLALRYHLTDDAEKVTLAVHDADGNERHTATPNTKAGLHTHRWNLRVDGPDRVPGAVGWPGTPPGPRIPPGEYTVTVKVTHGASEDLRSEREIAVPFHVHGDPRLDTTPDDYAEQFELQWAVRNAIDEAHDTVNRIRAMRPQIKAAVARAKGMDGTDELEAAAKALQTALTEIEETIIQTRSKSSQDPLNFPIRLNDKLSGVMNAIGTNHRPTEQVRAVFADLQERMEAPLARFAELIEDDIPAFNELVQELEVPAVPMPAEADD